MPLLKLHNSTVPSEAVMSVAPFAAVNTVPSCLALLICGCNSAYEFSTNYHGRRKYGIH